MYHVEQMNNGRWYVLRTANDALPKLPCEDAGWSSKRAAEGALKRDLKKLNEERNKAASENNGQQETKS